MVGLSLLLILLVYVAFIRLVIKSFKHRRTKVMVFVVLLIVPICDHYAGYIKFQEVCKSDSGFKLHRSVDGVEGFVANSIIDKKLFKKYSYEYIDEEKGNSFVRITLGHDDKYIYTPMKSMDNK